MCRQVAFVERGGLRYFYTVDGEERTGQFFFEGSWYADYDSFLDQKPARVSIEAIEPARLWLLPRADLYRLYEERPVFERFGRPCPRIQQPHRGPGQHHGSFAATGATAAAGNAGAGRIRRWPRAGGAMARVPTGEGATAISFVHRYLVEE